MNHKKFNFGKNLIYLLLFSTLIRCILAFSIEFGNDEVYYWTYAFYPALSHFDHPPMVGWIINLFSFNLYLNHEFFIRLGSIVLGTFNTWFIYRLGCKLLNQQTGWYAALLYTASVYCFLIAGVFILPDTPQLFFWLLSLNLFFSLEPWNNYSPKNNYKFLLLGITLGLGMLSKYTTAFLALGMLAYIIFFNRKWLKIKYLYFAILISILFFLPVVIWNVENNFISFTFHSARVETGGHQINFQSFFTEFFGEILYSNPIVWGILVSGLIFIFRKKHYRINPKVCILLLTGLPLIFTFWLVALTRNTLPHWTGPGFVSIIPLGAFWLSQKKKAKGKLFPTGIAAALIFLILGLSLALVQIKTGFINFDKPDTSIYEKGKTDFSLDLYGWRQLGGKFEQLANQDVKNGMMPVDAPIVSHRWFPAANFEYYVAQPTHRNVFAIGDLEAIHKYHWINEQHGGLQNGSNVYYITSSRDFHLPTDSGIAAQSTIFQPELIPIYRNNKIAYYFFVYRIKNLTFTK